ncbi:hypothetical protein AKO1_005514, partial [Acrasis kona]
MPFAFCAKVCRDGRIQFLSPCKVPITVEDYKSQMTTIIDNKVFERYTRDPRSALEDATNHMASFGYIHDDLQWRHLALLPYQTENKTWSVVPILIDLASVSTEEKKGAAAAFYKQRIEELVMEIKSIAENNQGDVGGNRKAQEVGEVKDEEVGETQDAEVEEVQDEEV